MNWENFEITFEIKNESSLFWADRDGRKVLHCVLENGLLDVAVTYDFMEEQPLHLTAAAQPGDKARVRFFPYRLELYVNEIIADEEWPCGDHRLDACPITDNGCSLQIRQVQESKHQEPSVLGVFQNAEGWKPAENVFVGDCMPFSHNGVYHVLYLKDRHHHGSKWGRGAHQWSHISTEDFVNWNMHPMAVEIDRKDEGSICTGSWICHEDKQYLFYTVRMCDGSPAKICRSVSSDGYHFEKDRDFAFTLSEQYTAPSARDPKIIKDTEGLFHMVLTTTHRESGRGCLAHLVSEDLVQWRELEQPLYMAPEGMWEPECPDYFYKDGYYYLIFSLYGKAYYQYSKKQFTDWQQPEDPVIPCKTVPKAASWQGRLIFAGFDGNGVYGGTMTFLEAVVQEDGQLTYKKLV